MNRIIALSTLVMFIAGCSGGNAGSSSGSGGGDPATTPTGPATNILAGEYTGTITFTSVNSTATITIDIDNNGNVTVTSDSGSTSGNVSGTSFTSSGTIGFNLGTQTCSGLTNIDGTGSGTSLNGTVSTASADCVENGVTTTISLDGTFNASL